MAPRTYNKVLFTDGASGKFLSQVPDGKLESFHGIYYNSDATATYFRQRYQLKTPASTKVQRFICRCGHVDTKSVCPACGNTIWMNENSYHYEGLTTWMLNDDEVSTTCAFLEYNQNHNAFVVHFDKIRPFKISFNDDHVCMNISKDYDKFNDEDYNDIKKMIDDIGMKNERYARVNKDSMSAYNKAILTQMLKFVPWIEEISDHCLKRMIEANACHAILEHRMRKHDAYKEAFNIPEFLVDVAEQTMNPIKRLSSKCLQADEIHQNLKEAIVYSLTHKYLSIDLFETLMDYETTNMLEIDDDKFAEFFIKNIIQYNRDIFCAWEKLSENGMVTSKEYNSEMLYGFISKRATERRANQLVNGLLGANPTDAIIEFANSLS